MAMGINTNITAMIGQQNLNESKNALTTSMERLSSGSRINSAKDDAAGQAIANRMSSQITGLGQAQRNANDGISVAQTAEGALNQVNDNLQRVRELSVQAQNGTNSQEDLNSIQAEIGQRLNEINRISEQTDFNGTKVLQQDGALKIQVGANDNETISIDLQKIDATSLGLNNFTVSGDKAADLQTMVDEFGAEGTSNYTVGIVDDTGTSTSTAGNVEVDVVSGKVTDGTNQLYVSQTTGNITSDAANTSVTDGAAGTLAQDVANAFGAAFETSAQGDSATVGGVSWTRDTAATATQGNGTYSATIEGQDVTVTLSGAGAGGAGGTLSIDEGSLFADDSTFGGANTYDAGTNFTTFGTNEVAREVDVKDAGGSSVGASLTLDGNNYSVDAGGQVTSDAAVTVEGNDLALNEVVYVKDAGQASQALVGQSDAQEASRNPLEKLDTALGTVDSLRSDLGAIQNRFESAITNLSTNETNLSSARSRIEDADYATEVANMTKNQILQQAGTSVLAQANQLPQSVLSLLG
ncbi:flagellin [Halomonas sp. CS7]|uniref:Flagellin n=1 Tax=Halomonas pelophila TaxID=3151122 RepID=A0ABV1N0H3_9GAMM